MEQKMAPGTGLTTKQKQLLDVAVNDPYITSTFYLSGGTALASWYFHHRESFDLDFFANTAFDYEIIKRWFKTNQSELGFKYSVFNEDYGFLTVSLRYPDDSFLKIDFSHYTKNKISLGEKWSGLEIDDLYDIAVNKLDTIATTPRTRDYVDLYFILKKEKYPLEQLIYDASQKFQEKIDDIQLSKNFLKVIEYTDLPKMLVPFSRKNMDAFYENLAKSLEKYIFR